MFPNNIRNNCNMMNRRKISNNAKVNGVMVTTTTTMTTMTMDRNPEGYYPYYFHGTVVTGFGRGGRQLNCPTANLDDSAVSRLPEDFPCGVFYGYANVDRGNVYGMVMSIGWNPQFKNERKTIEVHILHQFDEDFYGSELRAVAVGFLRSMISFNSLDELKLAIRNDVSTAKKLLSAPEMLIYKKSDFFTRK